MIRTKSNPNPKSKIDWEDIHLRMNDLHEKLAHTSYLTCDEKRTIMISRAQELAQESREKNNQREVIENLRVRLASEMSGLETEYDHETIILEGIADDQLIISDAAYLFIDTNIIVNEEGAYC